MKLSHLLKWAGATALAAFTFTPTSNYAQGTNCIPAPEGLVSWWRAEGNALDTADGNHGIPFGNTSYTAGRVGQAYLFDGNGDASFLGSPANLQLQDFTIETWIKRTSPAAVSVSPNSIESALVSYGSGGYGFGLSNNGSLFLTKVGTDRIGVVTAITNTNWRHVAVTKTGTTVVFYVDGTAFPAAAYTNTFTFGSSMVIGANGDLAYSFLGAIDEASIYSRALGAAEIQAIANAGTNGKCLGLTPPVIIVQPTNQTAFGDESRTFSVQALGTAPLTYQWQMAGTNLPDATNTTLAFNNLQLTNSGNYVVVVTNAQGAVTSSVATLTVMTLPQCLPKPTGLISWWKGENNANDSANTNHGGVVGGATFASGVVGQSFVFDGVNDSINMAHATNLDVGSQVTVEFWMKTGPSNLINSCCQGLVTSDFYLMEISSGNGAVAGVNFSVSTDNGASYAQISDVNGGGALISTQQWHHVAGTYDGTKLQLYVDGLAWGNPRPKTGNISPATANGFVTIGSENGRLTCPGCVGTRYFNGQIDEPAIYNRALTSAEIRALYLAGENGKCISPRPPVFVQHPTNQTLMATESVSFQAQALGDVPLTYQWQFNGTNILGATSATYFIASVQFTNAGTYGVVASNLLGAVLSSNAVLTVTPPPPCAPPPAGLVTWLRAEGLGNDSIGTNHGSLQGMAFAPNRVGQGFNFSNNAYVKVPASPTLNIANPASGGSFTVELWINPTTLGTQPVVEWLTNSSAGVHLWLSQPTPFGTGAGCLYANLIDVGGTFHPFTSGPGLVISNAYQHLALTYNRTNGVAAIYLNGAAIVQQSMGIFNPQTAWDLYLGTRLAASPQNFWAGQMDEVSLYKRALSGAEIAAIYQGSVSGKCTGPAAPVVIVNITNQTTYAGASVAFQAQVLGTAPLTYQWLFNGTNIVDMTNSALVLNNIQFANAGNYSMLASNAFGWTGTSNALLTVTATPPCLPAPDGLIAWWRGEGNPQDAVSGLHGVLTNGTSFAPGLVGQALDLNGVGSHVTVPDSNLWNFGTNSFSIELWVNFRGMHPSIYSEPAAPLVANDEGPFNTAKWWLAHGGGELTFHANSPTLGSQFPLRVPFQPVLNQWYHLALVRSGNALSIYTNGLAAGMANIPFALPNANVPLTLGRAEYCIFTNGMLDEVSIYGRGLSAAEVRAIYQANAAGKCVGPSAPVVIVPPTNQTVYVTENATFAAFALGTAPLAYQWQLNGTNLPGATGTTLAIVNAQLANAGNYTVVVTNAYGMTTSSNALLVVNPLPPCAPAPAGMVSWWTGGGIPTDVIDGNSGTLVNQATYGPGKVGQGFVFDGNLDGVQVGLANNLRLQSFSIEGWIKRTSSTTVSFNGNGTGLIFGLGNSGGYGFYLRSSGALELGKFSEPGPPPSAGAVTDTGWHHVAVTKTNTSVTFYVDGVAYAAAPYAGTYTFNAVGYIGAWAGLSTIDNSFYGAIDELSVYDRALTTNEVQSIYAANLTGKCPMLVPPSIAIHPRNTNVLLGTTAGFSVLAGGSVPFTYQWQFNGINLPGITNSSFVIPNVQTPQGGNYSVVVSNAAGFVVSSNALLSITYPPNVVRAVTTNAMGGNLVTVPITLTAYGIENTIGFSLNFNTQRIIYVSSAWGGSVTGASLLLNTNQAGVGRLGFGISFPPGIALPAGTQTVAQVTFSTLPLVGTPTTFSTNLFGDVPVAREIYNLLWQTNVTHYSNGVVVLAPTIFESDVFPRTNGNQVVSTIDLAQIARFVVRLDTPTPVTNEFQRADSAPRATLGDGQLKVTDWVQAGRYLAGWDFTPAIGGPSNEVAPTVLTPSLNRQLRVVGTNVTQGETATISVNLDSPGSENAIGFTLSYDPTLVFVSAVPGSSAAGANLTANPSQTGSGRLGLILGLPPGTTFGGGDKELIKVTLTAPASGTFPLALTDQIATRSASDGLADELAVSYFGGTLTVNPTNPPPTLTIGASGTNVVVAWPAWAGDYSLQAASVGPSGWTNVAGPLQTNGGYIFVTLPTTNETRYFRLQR